MNNLNVNHHLDAPAASEISETVASRIAYLISQYPAVNHTFILREIIELRRGGLDVCVASVSPVDRPHAQMTAEEQSETATTCYVKSTALLTILARHLRTFINRPASYLGGLIYVLKLARFDITQLVRCLFYFAEAVVVGVWMQSQNCTHLHTHFSSTVALFVRQVFPVTISMTIHGPGEFTNPRGFWLREKIIASDFVVAISDYARSQLMLNSPASEWHKLEVCRLGINPAQFQPIVKIRTREDVFEVICVGRLAAVKAQHILIRAMHRLLEENRNVRLRLVGDGEDRASLESEVRSLGINQHVIFDGWRNQDEVHARYEQADCFALASFAEGVPVVLMEAMAMNLPCIATRITGVPELIRDGVDGLLVAPSSVEELAEAIARLMDDEALRARLCTAGRRRVMDVYDLPRNVARLADIFTCRVKNIERVSTETAQTINRNHATTRPRANELTGS